jgi:DNA polymerase-3 subunit epsilon
LLDSEILAEVYIELIGGKQADLGLGVAAVGGFGNGLAGTVERPQRLRPLAPRLDEAAIAAHQAFILTLKSPLWSDYLGLTEEKG